MCWVFTLGQLILLDSAGAIGIKWFKDCLPLVNIIIELLELSEVNGTGGVLVKKIWKENGIPDLGRVRVLVVVDGPTLWQLSELDISRAVPVYALKQRLPLIDVIKEGSELVDVNWPRVVSVKHVCAKENGEKKFKQILN